MGRHDDITPERIRADLRRFAQLVLRLDAEGRLLEGTPRIMRLMGDLRQKLFAWEVRGTGRLVPEEEEGEEPAAPGSAELRESLRVVEEALKRAREAEEEWGDPGRAIDGE